MLNIKELLGKRIKELRKKQNLTQEKLAELANIEIPSLSNIENGKNYPNYETLEKISNALNVRAFELFLFEYYKEKEVLIDEMVKTMTQNELLTQQMYKFFLSIK
jgi:transcriptional regulator with XRE-family HTH domain